MTRLLASMAGDPGTRETTTPSGNSAPIISGTIDDSRSPALVSPPDIKTPPSFTGKRNDLKGSLAQGKDRAGSEPIDPSALSKALKEFEEAGNIRERTPGGSPSRKRQRIYGDRLVEFPETMSDTLSPIIMPLNGASSALLNAKNHVVACLER